MRVAVELTIGQAIKRTMKSKGITSLKLSEMTGYHPNIICNWLTDKNAPIITAVIDIADALGVSIDELIGREVKKLK